MRYKDESRWSEALVKRTLDLAIFKYGNPTRDDLTIVRPMILVEDVSPKIVQRLLEIVDLAREIYYSTAAMRRTAKGGILDLPDWQVRMPPETERLVKEYDNRRLRHVSAEGSHGMYIADERWKAPWWTYVATPNDTGIVFPVRSSISTHALMTINEAPEQQVPAYLLEPYFFGAAAEALLPFRSSLEDKLGFRLEEMFACIASIQLAISFAENYDPLQYQSLQRTGITMPLRNAIVEYAAESFRKLLPEYGIAVPSNPEAVADEVIAYLTLSNPRDADLRLRTPIRPFTEATEERLHIDLNSLRLALHEPFSLVPHLGDDDAQRRSDEFEVVVHQYILKRTPGASEWRLSSVICFSDDGRRQIDSGIIIDDVLLISECKARSTGLHLELPAPNYLASVWRTSREHLSDVDTLAKKLATVEISNEPKIPDQIRYLLPIVVQPNPELSRIWMKRIGWPRVRCRESWGSKN